MIHPIRIVNDVFSRKRKMILSIRSHRGVWVSRQNSHLLLQLASPLRTHSTRKVSLKEFFSLKKWKTFRKWSGIVSFVSLSIKKTVESRRNNSGKGKTERDVSFCCAFCRSYFAILLKFTYLQLCNENKQAIPLFCTAHPLLHITLRHPRWRRFFPLERKEQTRAPFAELEVLFAKIMPQISWQLPGLLSQNKKMKEMCVLLLAKIQWRLFKVSKPAF